MGEKLPLSVPPSTEVAGCAFGGCEEPGALACRYVDRDGNACPTRWCRAHLVAVRGRPYCRRHGSVIVGLPDGTPLEGTLPPVDNRAVSLLRWTGDTLDPLMRRVLAHHRPEGMVLVDPVRVVREGGGAAIWRRSWAVADGRTQVAIDLDVAESTDSELIASVDGTEVARRIPPWITRRSVVADDDVDAMLRREFYEALVTAVRLAVEAA